jgi:hypothetical protein
VRQEIRVLINEISNTAQELNSETQKKNIEKINDLLRLSDLDFFEKGILYWQLQDHYALLRDFDREGNVLQEFTTYLRNENSSYLFWALCDMTQILTLRLGHYNDLVDEVFDDCLQITIDSDELIMMRFEMLRAYVGIFTDTRVLIENHRVEMALDLMNQMIEIYTDYEDILFFKMTYFASVIKYSNYRKIDYSNMLDALRDEMEKLNSSLLNDDTYKNNPTLFGSWHDISRVKGSYFCAKVGTTNLLFALAEAKNIDWIHCILKQVPNYKITNKRLLHILMQLGVDL